MHEGYYQHRRRSFGQSNQANALALVPVSLLPYRPQWQALANALPPGSVLVCLPTAPTSVHQAAWDAIVQSLRAAGHPVLVVSMERFLESIQRG